MTIPRAMLFVIAIAAPPAGGDFVMEASVVQNGGGLATGEGFLLQSVVGQAAPTIMSRGGLQLQGGLLAPGVTDILFFDYFEEEG